MNKTAIIVIIIIIALAAGTYFLFFQDKSDNDGEVFYNYAVEDAFITNVKKSEKLFKTTVVLVVNKKDMNEFFKENLFTIRDTILFILRDLTEEDIESTDIQQTLRGTIAEALNEALGIDNIVTVKFSDFVMQ
jgi:flagellar basal body-associated protein FliL